MLFRQNDQTTPKIRALATIINDLFSNKHIRDMKSYKNEIRKLIADMDINMNDTEFNILLDTCQQIYLSHKITIKHRYFYFDSIYQAITSISNKLNTINLSVRRHMPILMHLYDLINIISDMQYSSAHNEDMFAFLNFISNILVEMQTLLNKNSNIDICSQNKYSWYTNIYLNEQDGTICKSYSVVPMHNANLGTDFTLYKELVDYIHIQNNKLSCLVSELGWWIKVLYNDTVFDIRDFIGLDEPAITAWSLEVGNNTPICKFNSGDNSFMKFITKYFSVEWHSILVQIFNPLNIPFMSAYRYLKILSIWGPFVSLTCNLHKDLEANVISIVYTEAEAKKIIYDKIANQSIFTQINDSIKYTKANTHSEYEKLKHSTNESEAHNFFTFVFSTEYKCISKNLEVIYPNYNSLVHYSALSLIYVSNNKIRQLNCVKCGYWKIPEFFLCKHNFEDLTSLVLYVSNIDNQSIIKNFLLGSIAQHLLKSNMKSSELNKNTSNNTLNTKSTLDTKNIQFKSYAPILTCPIATSLVSNLRACLLWNLLNQ